MSGRSGASTLSALIPAAVVPAAEPEPQIAEEVIEVVVEGRAEPSVAEAAEAQTADEVAESLTTQADEVAADEEAAQNATSPRPLTRPIVIPEINVAELGVADRLGLSDFDDDDEVGPTS